MRPPQEKGHWLMGSVADLQKAPHAYPGIVAQKHGGIARFRILHRRFIAISDPNYYDQIMVKNHLSYERGVQFRNQHVLFGRGMVSTEGSEWSKKRTRAQPSFNREALKKTVPLSVKTVERFIRQWDEKITAGEELSLIPEMQKLTISVICQALFSVDIDQKIAVQFCEDLRDSMLLIRKKNQAIFPLPLWLPHKSNDALKANRDVMNAFVKDKIVKRKKKKESDPGLPDILDNLLAGKEFNDLSLEDQEEIVSECKTLLVAGFETTALTLTWALYSLARYPEVAKKWHEECDQVLKDRDNPEFEDLDNLDYTRQIVFETMRLYPVIFTQPRECVKDDQLGPYKIKKGDMMLLSNFGIHRDGKVWESPEEFRPERFADGVMWPRKSYMPFGKGKHTCIGNTFAAYEMLTALSMIGKRYTINRKDPSEVGVKATITLMPDRDIFLTLGKRS